MAQRSSDRTIIAIVAGDSGIHGAFAQARQRIAGVRCTEVVVVAILCFTDANRSLAVILRSGAQISIIARHHDSRRNAFVNASQLGGANVRGADLVVLAEKIVGNDK